ncbi:MAG: hypothetical protein P8N76_14790 [Pirellulaceae bacterium]|nr:hypothetical protein [Pirellulaceae bacterium]
MSYRTQLRIVSGILLGLMLVSTLSAQDTVTLNRRTRRGSKVLGNIKTANRNEVIVETSGSERTIPVNEIDRIGLAGEPAPLRQGRASIHSGQYEQALKSLDDVRIPSGASDILKQEAAFYRASAMANLALRGTGSPNNAISLLLAFVKNKTTRNSYHFYETVELLGDLALMIGSYDKANLYYKQLAKAPWPEYKLKSAVLEGAALRAEGKFNDAVTKFDQALSAQIDDPESMRQQTFAQIGKAASIAELGKTDEAIQTLEDVVAKNDAADAQLFAQAYLAQGAAYRKANRPLDAVLAYLHVDLMFFNQRDAHAEALFYLSELWPKVNSPDRGVQARSLLKSRYGSTGWAKRS